MLERNLTYWQKIDIINRLKRGEKQLSIAIDYKVSQANIAFYKRKYIKNEIRVHSTDN